MAVSVCLCFYECLYPLPPRCHLKRKKVYNLFKSGQWNISPFARKYKQLHVSVEGKSVIWGKGRHFSNVACSNHISPSPPACSLNPAPGQHGCEPPQPQWQLHPRSTPFPVAALARPCLCISWEAEVRSLGSWQVALAFTMPCCYSDPFQSTGTISSFVIPL